MHKPQKKNTKLECFIDNNTAPEPPREYVTTDGDEFEFCPVLLCNRCGKVDAITLIESANDGEGTELNYCKNCEPQTSDENIQAPEDKPDKQSHSKKNAKGSKQQQLL